MTNDMEMIEKLAI